MNSIKGKLTVKVIEAKLSRDTEMFASMDPYVKMLCGGTEYQTTIHQGGGKKPHWNQQFDFNIVGERLLTLKVMDKDQFSSDTIGQCSIKLDDVYMENRIDKWHSLIYENEGAGQIHVILTFAPLQSQLGNGYQTQNIYNAPPVMMMQQQPSFMAVGMAQAMMPQMMPMMAPQPMMAQPMMQPMMQPPMMMPQQPMMQPMPGMPYPQGMPMQQPQMMMPPQQQPGYPPQQGFYPPQQQQYY